MTDLHTLEQRLLAAARASPEGKLTDTHFPPVAASIGLDRSANAARPAGSGAVQEFTWRRAAYHGFLLNGPIPDVVQGMVADCWFLSVANLVAHRQDLIRRIVAAEHSEAGFYIFRFFKNGSWIFVYVDDFLPMNNGRLAFASSEPSDNPLFPLLEKAYAKLRGNYAELGIGPVAAAFTDLTGDFCDTSRVGTKSWEEINRALSEGWLVATCPFQPGLGSGVEMGHTGIYANHAYSLLIAMDVGGHQLLRLRNPWGRLEWKGAWSDGDTRDWNRPEVANVPHEVKDDGEFWIDFADFRRYFDLVIVCRLYDAPPLSSRWQRKALWGTWGVTSGGSQNPAANPKFALQLSAPAPVYIALSQEDTTMARSRHKQNFAISFSIYEGRVLRDGTPNYTLARDVTLEAKLGTQPYLLVPSTFNPGETGIFDLTVFCPVNFTFAPT
jgi:hypothetical protein